MNALVARFRDLDPGAMNDAGGIDASAQRPSPQLAVGTIAALLIVAVIAWYVAANNAAQLAHSLSESDFREAAVELGAGRQREAHALLARALRTMRRTKPPAIG